MAIVNGEVVAWADTLEELAELVHRMGYSTENYYAIEVPCRNLLIM